MEKFGYIRVSAKDQNPERQKAALRDYDIPPDHLFIDYMSGKDFSRPAYQEMMGKISKGDLVIVKSIDRLGRNYVEILEQWRKITKEIGADMQIIDMPLLNTNASHGDLTGVFISDLVLQILAYVAETERNFIKQRQAEGISAAKAQGKKFGCPRVEEPEGFEIYCNLWQEQKISSRKAAKLLGMSHSTFYRRCKEKNA